MIWLTLAIIHLIRTASVLKFNLLGYFTAYQTENSNKEDVFPAQYILLQFTFSFICWQLYNEVPLVRHLPLPHQTILVTAKEVDVFMKKEMEEHRATLTPGDPRDFTDAYLEEMQKVNFLNL